MASQRKTSRLSARASTVHRQNAAPSLEHPPKPDEQAARLTTLAVLLRKSGMSSVGCPDTREPKTAEPLIVSIADRRNLRNLRNLLQAAGSAHRFGLIGTSLATTAMACVAPQISLAAETPSATFNILAPALKPDPWNLNNTNPPLNVALNPDDGVGTSSISLDVKTGYSLNSTGYTLEYFNNPTTVNQILFGFTGGGPKRAPDTANLMTNPVIAVSAKGVEQSAGGTTGPSVFATVTYESGASFFGSVLSLLSQGANGLSDVNDGGHGGTVTYEQSPSYFNTTLDTLTGSTQPSLPWSPDYSVTSVASKGGDGVIYDTPNRYVDVGTGGTGGSVTASLSGSASEAGSLFSGSSPASGTTTLAQYLFLSQGGSGAADSRHTGDAGVNGGGGTVSVATENVNWESSLPQGVNVYGLVAASVGGASKFTGSGITMNLAPSGAGGNVDLTLQSTNINFGGDGKSIGLVATSTGDVIVPNGRSLTSRIAPNTFGSVTVSLSDDSSIQATQTGVIANSSPGWSTDPFSGASTVTLESPGSGGPVTVTNSSDITVTGTAPTGILMQSIGGSSASVLGTGLFVGDSGGQGGSGGNISYGLDATGGSAQIIVHGDGSTGLLMQTIGGGGGNGANADGLYVAVGGAGGDGGDGGAIDLSNFTNQTITTKGLHAKGIVAQTIGGGGGNGGFAKAYGKFVGDGIGGKGGSGGDGGDITLHSTNSTITTTGQHAYGMAFQSIGGGGGTGGGEQTAVVGAGFTIGLGVGGKGASGGAGGELDITLDDKSSVTTTGLDAHGVLLQSISGGGGAGGAASGATYNIGQIPDVPLKINFNAAVGGSGGSSQTPGVINVSNAGTIATSGAGSHGLVLQSIGGGGGHGADSTSGTNSWGDFGKNPVLSFDSSMAVGGSGGAAGDGGAIRLSSNGTISTAGHNSMGLLAQTIGGGGGTAGAGNAYDTKRWIGNNTGEGQDTTMSISTTLGSGGSGGSAGDGGFVSLVITPDKGTGFTTVGSGSSAVVAQSIGGGGGVAGDAGTQAINGGTVTIGMQLGGAGGNGGTGGSVAVSFTGNIQTGAVTQLQYKDASDQIQASTPVTIGGSSHGIVAQSIGGGGGIGGNADPSTALVPTLNKDIASWSLEPKALQKVLGIKDGIEFWAKRVVDNPEDRPTFSVSYSSNLSVGGKGGLGGDGDVVSVQVPGRSDITTYGHHSYGILAQSVGGGGGAGGSASANSLLSSDISAGSLGKSYSVGLNLNVGGSGGASGSGGDVTVTISNLLDKNYDVPNNAQAGNFIRTGGYASHAVFAQSVGGGGGIGHEGSILGLASIQGWKSPGATLGHVSSGQIAAGDGGSVVVGTSDTPIAGWIESAGDASSLLFAQSIGGGGGTLSFGCTTNGRAGNDYIRHSPCFTDAAPTTSSTDDFSKFSAGTFFNTEQKFDLTVNANGGSGGTVTVNLGDSHLTTDGDRAIAIVAQSIGGGGGYVSADARNVGYISQPSFDSSANNAATGADVQVNLAGGTGGKGTAYVSTYGQGAWGVLAQSIGGSGGLFGDTSLDIVGVPQATASTTAAPYSQGGNVTVKLSDAIIKTEGRNSHAIVAQSWSDSGGIFAGSGQNLDATLVMGSKLSKDPQQLLAGTATVDVDGSSTVSALGDGSIAILSQASSSKITIDGTVTGGKTYQNANAKNRTIQGVGVMISGGNSSTSNEISIGKTGNLTTVGGTDSGYAIMTDVGKTNVTNYGTITGSVDLGSNPGIFTNESGGTLNQGAVYIVGNNSLHNYGTNNIGEESTVSTTNLQGRFVQYDSGRLLVTFDSLAGQKNDKLNINGTAIIGGSIETRARSLLPGSYEFLTGSGITLTARAVDRMLFAWDAKVTSTGITTSPTRRFRPPGLRMSPTSTSLVSYLERAWDNADPHHAELFGYKHELDRTERYNSLLEGLGGQALNAQPLQLRMATLGSLSESLDCHASARASLGQDSDTCVWARLTGDVSNLSSSADNLGFRSSGGGFRVGAQHGLGDGWTVGGTLGYGLNYLTSNNFSSNGQFFDLSLSATRDVGQWSLAGSIGYAYGRFENNRQVNAPAAGIAPGFNHQYTSDSSVSIFGAKLRTAYTFDLGREYIRPYLDLDLTYSHAPGFSESGQGNLALAMHSASQWNVGISPMIEFGTDYLTQDKTRVKMYASVGAMFLPDNQQKSPASFVGASALNGTFNVINAGPNVLGMLNLGVQIYAEDNYEVQAQYGLRAGEQYWSQSLSASVTYRF